MLYVLRAMPVFGPGWGIAGITPGRPRFVLIFLLMSTATANAKRVRRYRARKSEGATVMTFTVINDEVAFAEMMIEAGLLDPNRADDKLALNAALTKWANASVEQHKNEKYQL